MENQDAGAGFAVAQKLVRHAYRMGKHENHLKFLTAEKSRFTRFSIQQAGIFYDFSRQRLDEQTLACLLEFAEEKKVIQRFTEMVTGAEVNETEHRAALHTACRDFSETPIYFNNKDIMPEIRSIRDAVKDFTDDIRHGRIKGSTGKPFESVVVIGIGGSYLGTQFVTTALEPLSDRKIGIDYLSNVDIHNFGRIVSRINPETTLWVIISKSYTTAETLANKEHAYELMASYGLDPSRHVVTVTAKGSPGDDPSNPVAASFNMFDFIGGRYSVTSAVGAVPISLFLGYGHFEKLLKGAYQMDQHAQHAPAEKNIALISALIGFWNYRFLGYCAQAIIPYADPLKKLPAHIQQLYMESNGKSVSRKKEKLDYPTGVIIFGEPGTNAQHSFFQLAHQGRSFPIDFIGVARPFYHDDHTTSKGVTNHQELWANLLSQPKALAEGKDDPNPERSFSGNRPSSTIVIEDLSAENIGRLLAFYEARTIYEAFLWDINPFDQYGVELGKTIASEVRSQIAEKNKNENHEFKHLDETTRFYLNILFNSKDHG